MSIFPPDMVVTHLPSPLDVGAEKVEKLLCPVTRSYDSLPPATQALKEGKDDYLLRFLY